MSALLAGAPTAPAEAAGRRIDIELQDVEIRQALRTFAEIGRVNIVPEKGVQGRVTARLRDMPWDEALEQIVCSLGYVLEWDGNVIYVRHPKR